MISDQRQRRLRKDERGTAVVEFALVLPVLLLVLFGIFQFGLLFYNYIDLTSAGKDGARTAAVSRAKADGVQAIKDAIAKSTSVVDDSNLTITVSPPQPWKAGDTVTIHISYPYSLSIMGISFWGGPMTTDAQVRIE